MSRQGGPQSERSFLTKIAVGSGFVITWFMGTLAAELLGGQANETSLGRSAGRLLLISLVVVVPLITLVWAGIKLWKWRHPAPPEPPPPPPPPNGPSGEPEPATWRPPGPIHDRDDVVAATVETLFATGIAVVHGARDVGTSAVAEAAVQSLIELGRIEERDVACVDLRSRSSRTPDDARATAGRILSMFRQDEPANGTPEVLANAAERLHDVLAKQYSVLLLDNVAVPDEVSWLIPQWTERNNRRPWLVIAGEAAIAAVAPGSQVAVPPLSANGMRKIWHADTGTEQDEPVPLPAPRRHRLLPRWVHDLLRPRRVPPPPAPPSTPDPVDALVTMCRGRPRAIKAVARETAGPDRETKVLALLASMNTDENNPLVGIWRAVLARAEDSFSPEATWLLHALAVIPVTALTREAVAALLAAHAPDAEAGSPDALPGPLEELRVRDFVEEVRGRYRLPLEIRWAIAGQAGQTGVDTARIAVPALVRHHADRVVRRANQLDVRSVGARAAMWLHDEEPTLRVLFSFEHYEDSQVLHAVIDDLARIAGALEYWYVREQQADGLLKVSAALGELADRAQRGELSALAAARKATAYRMIGQPGAAEDELALVAIEARAATSHDVCTELVTRLHVEKALLGLARGESARDGTEQAKVRRSLEEIAADRRHPGAGIAAINLGAMHLAENAPDAARPYLEQAEAMAGRRRDTGCQAQAVELLGIALSGSDLHEAVSRWQEAKQLFLAIGEEQGQARCLQHLGAAALVDETVAARLADGTRGAVPLLTQSKKLRAGQPDTALVDEYLRTAHGDVDPDAPAGAPG